MKLCELVFENEYEAIEKIPLDIEICSLASKLEEITPESLFFLNESIKIDTEFIIKYIEKNTPKVILCQKGINLNGVASYVLYVENTRRTMSYVYSRFYQIDFDRLKFIGVTGTNGKTSTATLIRHILNAQNEKVGFIGTGVIKIGEEVITDSYYSMTTPDVPLLYSSIKKMQDSFCKYIVMEVSSHALYFEKLAPINFEIGIFTNLSPEHLDFHNSLEEYFEAKNKLFEKSKIGIFNADDKYSKRAYRQFKGKAYTIGILWPADVMARDISLFGFSGTEYIYREEALIFKMRLSSPGAYNIYNSMMALKAAIVLGIKACDAKSALMKNSYVEGRFEIINAGGLTIVIDYAHTPEAFKNILKSINSLKNPRQNLIAVFGCGGERDKSKRSVIGKYAEELSDFCIITNDNPRNENESEIISDILSGFKNTDKRLVILSRKSAIEYAIINAKAGDIIALIGKGAEKYSIDKNGYHPFYEKEIIKEAIDKRNRKEEEYENKAGTSADGK